MHRLLHRVAEEAIRVRTIMPRFLQMEISRDCNLNCIGCYRNDKSSLAHFEGKHNLSLGLVQRMIGEIPSVKTMAFLGDGELLMNPELPVIMEYLTHKGKGMWVTTNGNLLTQEVIDVWGKYNIFEAHISIDTLHPKIYEKLRRGGEFYKVVEAIQMMGQSKIPCYLNCLGYQETIGDLPDIIRFAGENKVRGINYLTPIFMIGSDLNGFPSRIEDSKDNRLLVEEAVILAKEKGIFWIGGPPRLTPSFMHCNFPFGLPYITTDGDVYGCCYMVGGGRTEWYQGEPKYAPGARYKMGNIYETPFHNIWIGDGYKVLRNTIKLFERARGDTITPDQLQFIRGLKNENRFAYCKRCLWRWGVAC